MKLKTKCHELKIMPKYFRYVKWGIKKFELRKNDRGYEVGDYVKLREYNGEFYSGEFLWIKITYILDFEEGKEFGLSPGYCILGFKKRSWKNQKMGRKGNGLQSASCEAATSKCSKQRTRPFV